MTYPVCIVGAGPGNPNLLTLKALHTLKNANVVVYDRLVSKEIMALIPKGVTRIFAGKSCKQHFMTQEEINDALIVLAASGRKVVRLKGGDPFLFGRGGEEALALQEANIPFEIIPGITSASGCGAYAGIPLTHRGLATGVRFVTGHRQEDGLKLNWQSLADPDTTLVVYMGLVNSALLSKKLIEHGLPKNTPVAAIQEGTRPTQRTLTTTLDELVMAIEKAQLKAPTLLIIGKVADLHKRLDWFLPQTFSDLDEHQARRYNEHRL
jgi:uroporphyrin-III C-methyltransferase/precorrin-2 dehydrogenase/sirohydrochlorin ferrochelatase/uroporphyrin-III C-methyltransferase